MSRPMVPAARLRRRLTVAFVLVAALAAGTLAIGSYVLVSRARYGDSLARAEQTTRRNLTLATLPSPSGGPEAIEELAVRFESERGVPTILVVDGTPFPSNPALELSVPPGLQDLVDRGQIGFERMDIGGTPYLVTGAPAPDPRVDAALYSLFPEDRIHRDLIDLRNVLLVGFAVVVVLAGLVGRAVAGRTLRPVARASRAARSIAEGLLDTRLPVDTRDEFGAWAASFNEMAEALEAKIAALTEAQARERRFTSDVAHELRTPLTAIVSEASLLREHLDQMPEEARRPATMLVSDVARLRRLVEDLIEMSRFDVGRAAVQREMVDLGALAAAAIRVRGWASQVRLDADDVLVDTDRRRVERIVANLIGNALEHGGQDVAVRVGRDGTGAFVEVGDRGPGIPPEHLSHLFERFYKADPSRTGSGSGLGLAIASENAHLVGGSLEVWSEVGAGTRFTLRLPVAEPLPRGDVGVSFAIEDEAHEREGRRRP